MSTEAIEEYLPDEEATVEFGRRCGLALQEVLSATEQPIMVFLEGDLGAGKTTSTRGVLRAFGHSGSVKSPTYTLVEPYEFESAQVNHFDLYRLGDPEELEYMGIRDYFSERSVCLVEWPSRGQGVLPEADLHFHLSVNAPGRQVNLSARSELGRKVLACF
jgi:tRNA threonylcarbamoyladenosine biosynthesis protein TsaE